MGKADDLALEFPLPVGHDDSVFIAHDLDDVAGNDPVRQRHGRKPEEGAFAKSSRLSAVICRRTQSATWACRFQTFSIPSSNNISSAASSPRIRLTAGVNGVSFFFMAFKVSAKWK